MINLTSIFRAVDRVSKAFHARRYERGEQRKLLDELAAYNKGTGSTRGDCLVEIHGKANNRYLYAWLSPGDTDPFSVISYADGRGFWRYYDPEDDLGDEEAQAEWLNDFGPNARAGTVRDILSAYRHIITPKTGNQPLAQSVNPSLT